MTDSQLVPQADRFKTVQAWLTDPGVLTQFKAALPRLGITPERMGRIVMTEVRRNPKLATQCSIESLLGAAMACAQYGLEPGPMGLAWIIPYGNEAQFQIGYKGLVRLLYRSGQVKDIRCFAVARGDEFEMDLGADQPFRHQPTDPDRCADNVRGVYCAIRTTMGGVVPEWWSFEQIEAHRARFSKAHKSPWATDWIQMARKTVAIAASKFAPLSTEATAAIALDERATLGMPQGIELEVGPVPIAENAVETGNGEETPKSPESEPEDGAQGDFDGFGDAPPCPLPVGDEGAACGLTSGHEPPCEGF